MPSFSERWLNVVNGCGLDLTKPVNIVQTSCIEKHGGWETRKMVSIGTEKRQPKVFRQNGVFATPLSRTKVAIVKGKGFEKVEEIQNPVQVHKTDFALPDYLRVSRGEANFLTYAFECGLVSRFTNRPSLRARFSGKKRVNFTFRVDGLETLKVEGAQIEVDNSFGDDERFYLCEAKYGTPDSFNIRQLYYPFKTFVPEVKPREVRNLFFAYEAEDSEYRFWEYSFADPEDYESIRLVNSVRYKVQFTKNPVPLKQYAVQALPEQKAIQANNVYFLMDIPFLVSDGIDDTQKIALHFAVDRRQGQYYREAMEILGFLERRGFKSAITNVSEEYMRLPPHERTKFFVRRLSENPAVNEAIHRILAGDKLSLTELKEITTKHDPTISGDTIPRRARCLLTFFRFIADVMGYCTVENGVISLKTQKETLNGYR